MIVLPILERELRVRARHRATYWVRFAVALLGVLICLQSMGATGFSTPVMMGRYIFNGIVGAALFVSLSACVFSADAISAERRDGTLGLLFLTRVRVLDVLLGKIGSIGITSLGALMAFLPVLMVPVLAGGVTGAEAARKALGLCDALFLALSAGLCASAAQRERSHALRFALAFVTGVTLLPWLAYAVAPGGLIHYLGLLSPLVALISASDLAYAAAPRSYWSSVLLLQLFAWLLLTAAGFLLRRAVDEDCGGLGMAPARRREEATERSLGLGSWQPIKGAASLVEWVVHRESGINAGVWAIALLGLAAEGWMWLGFHSAGLGTASPRSMIAWPIAMTGGLTGGAILAWVASRFFIRFRHTGELELLLTTPVGAADIVSEQWKVLKRLFVWPVLVMQAPMLPEILTTLLPGRAGPAPDLQLQRAVIELLVVGNTLLGAAATCSLGLWLGLRAPGQAAAIAWTVGVAKAVPYVASFIFSVLTALLAGSPGIFRPGLLTWVGQIIILLFSVGVIAFTHQRLKLDLATGEPEPLRWPKSLLDYVRQSPGEPLAPGTLAR